MVHAKAVRIRALVRFVPVVALAVAACGLPARASTADPANLTWSALWAPEGTGAAAAPASAATDAAPAVTDLTRRIAEVATRHGVPVRLALAVARVESGMRCVARGRAGELGPLQIKPATARGLGYTGPVSALNSCGAGLEWGMRHLAAAYRRCGTHAGAAALHNRGLAASCGRTAYSARVTRLMANL